MDRRVREREQVTKGWCGLSVLSYTYVIVIVLAVHCIADFALQTSWQARNKSTQWDALLAHVATYTMALCVVPIAFPGISPNWVAANSVLHLATDFITSRISSRYFARGGAGSKGFWITIGVDQWIHASTLVLTLKVFAEVRLMP